MDRYLKANQALWDSWTPHHVTSEFYDVAAFKAGGRDLHPITLAGPGDVRGKSLLHLQCHFGLDSLVWARRGAIVTGVDFSAPAIAAARALAAEVQLPATFVHSNLYELRQHLSGQFDVVFTSHGVLGWLPDLEAWAQIIAHFLAPGGVFSIVEAHPFANVFDERRTDGELRVRLPYFRDPEPVSQEELGSYAVPGAPTRGVSYFWLHRVADIIESLLRAGLRLTSFAEYPFVSWRMFPWMEERADGMWHLPGGKRDIPLMFSLTATK